MTALERVQSILARITYKPGWELQASRFVDVGRARTSQWGIVFLNVIIKTKDVIDGKPVTICNMSSLEDEFIDRLSDKEVIEIFIGEAIRSAERHEMEEWYKFDGVCVYDPHPERKEKVA